MPSWRQRCPEGHTSLSIHRDTYRCRVCDEIYTGRPYDVDAVPTDEAASAPPTPDRETVLAAVVDRYAEPTTAWIRARDLDVGRPRQLGQILAQLADEGLVERVGSSSRAAAWRPTDAGRAAVDGVASHQNEDDPHRLEQRAQLTPIGTAALVFALGALLLVVLAGVTVATSSTASDLTTLLRGQGICRLATGALEVVA